MTPAERSDAMLMHALGLLDGEELTQLRAELAAASPQVLAELAEAEATVARLALALPPATPPAAAKAQLMQAIAARPAVSPLRDTANSPLMPRPPGTSATKPPVNWVHNFATMAIALVFAAGLIYYRHLHQVAITLLSKQLQEKSNELGEREKAIDRLDREIRRLDAIAKDSVAKDTRLAALDNQIQELRTIAEQIPAKDSRLALLDAEVKELRMLSKTIPAKDARLAAVDAELKDLRLVAAAVPAKDERLAALEAEIKGLRVIAAESEARNARIAALEKNLAEANASFAILHAVNLKLVALVAQGPQPAGAQARIFWDVGNSRWQLMASGLDAPAAGRTFELWFITADKQKIAAGTFDIDAHGYGQLAVDVPQNIGKIAVAAVTDEPQGGVQVPTGAIHLAGEVK